ncbi:hypothetical protein QE390_001748 [Siphonobacter sp. SORGH_AS 1065]|nr:hypothetical protein [Siphonobacter sp. SORGH_AS_1065]
MGSNPKEGVNESANIQAQAQEEAAINEQEASVAEEQEK